MKVPDLTPVESSMAQGYHYDPNTRDLHVRFKNGDMWRYKDVGADKAETLAGAASFGSSLNRLVLGKHEGERFER